MKVECLDSHVDVDHSRTVLTVAARPQLLASTLGEVARRAIDAIDINAYTGVHPAVGAVDVLPVVFLSERDRSLACDEALAIANRLAAEIELPVFLYGDLADSEQRRERSYFREGGFEALRSRMASGELKPDFGPPVPHPTAGATLVTARPPLVAFNVELTGATIEAARSIAASVREAGGGLPGVRALGLHLEQQQIVQVSMNIHDPFGVPLGEVVEQIKQLAGPAGASVSAAELVGLTPRAALDGLDLALLKDFDPDLHILENRIGIDGTATQT